MALRALRRQRLRGPARKTVLRLNFFASIRPNIYANRMHGNEMIRSLLVRVLVLVVAFWMPVQATASVSFSLCQVDTGNPKTSMSTSGQQRECQHMPATNYRGTACKLCFSCSFCPASFVENAPSSPSLRLAAVLTLQTSWSLVTFVTTPPEHPPRIQVLLV